MSAYFFSIGATAAVFVLLALSLNIITGYAGQAMMGQAAFFGIGAYTAAVLTQTYHVNFWLALVLGILFTGLCGAVLGLISLRLQADFLAITTIGINFVMVALFNNMSITGGSLGLTISKPTLFGQRMGNQEFFLLTLIVIVIVCLLIVKMRRSWFGMALASINNDAAAARSFGIDVSRYQILAFIIGTAIAGIYAHRMGYIASSDFAFTVSIQILSMVVIGGIGTIRGPILGALLLSVLPEALRFVSDFVSDYRSLVYGGLLVLMVRFMPGGLFGSSSPIVRGSLWVFRKITGKGGAAA